MSKPGNQSALWCIKGGKHGQNERRFLKQSRIDLWGGDYRGCNDLDSFKEMLAREEPGLSSAQLSHYAAQFRMLVSRMRDGDLVVLRQKLAKSIAVGKIVGEEVGYDPELDNSRGGNTRAVKWLETDLDKSVFGQDLLYSFGSFTTLCRISKNDALARVKAILKEGKDPGWAGPEIGGDESDDDPPAGDLDLVELAENRLRGLIETNLKGEGLANLIEGLLRARGYDVRQSDVGADEGIDIVAVPKLWDTNRHSLVVQVKSGGPVGHPEVVKLLGAKSQTSASVALLVSWGGFKGGVKKKTLKEATKLQLWESQDVLRELQECYEMLPESLRNALPMAKVWVPLG